MSGDKLEQAKKALKDNLQKLGSNDRFNIIAFSDSVKKFSNSMEDSSRVSDAINYVNSLSADGSTDLYNSQVAAVDMPGSRDGSTKIIVFLTDGIDTTGHSKDSIIEDLKEKMKGKNWRIYPFGIGKDVDFNLISSEANEFGDGIPVYVETDSDLEKVLTGFYDRISQPALNNASLDLSQFAYDVYPTKLDNLYAENTVIVAGRYNKTGNATIYLGGDVGGERRSWAYLVELPEKSDNSFVERAWAVRKIGHLMDQINLEGETDSLKEQVAGLGNRYALATPYTSLLVKAQKDFEEAKEKGLVGLSLTDAGYDIRLDDLEAHGDTTAAILSIYDSGGNLIDKVRIDPGTSISWTAPDGKVYDIYVSKVAPGYTFGAKWTEVSILDYQSKTNTTAILNQGESLSGASYTAASDFESGSLEYIKAFELLGTKEADDKTFVTNGTNWVDTACTGNESTDKIRFGSAGYFELLKNEKFTTYLSVSENMRICLSGDYALEIYNSNSTEESNYEVVLNKTKARIWDGNEKKGSIAKNQTTNSSANFERQDEESTEQAKKELIEAILEVFRGIFNFQ
jgi:hypothetical protein